MIIGASRIKINQNGEGEITIPKPIYYLILSRLEDKIELIL